MVTRLKTKRSNRVFHPSFNLSNFYSNFLLPSPLPGVCPLCAALCRKRPKVRHFISQTLQVWPITTAVQIQAALHLDTTPASKNQGWLLVLQLTVWNQTPLDMRLSHFIFTTVFIWWPPGDVNSSSFSLACCMSSFLHAPLAFDCVCAFCFRGYLCLKQ